jgi:hypothetical protein
MGRAKSMLGISVGPAGLAIAERTRRGTGPVAQFALSSESSLHDGRALGLELGRFLKHNGFTARQVVFGVPARWLVQHIQILPPADHQTADRILWNSSAEQAAVDLGDMDFDYAGQPSPTRQTTVLLLGIQRIWIKRLRALARAAGLHIVSVMPTGIAIAAATAPHEPTSLILSIRPDARELISADANTVPFLRQVGPSSSGPFPLAELRRSTAAAIGSLAAADSTRITDPSARRLVIWDEVGHDREFVESMGRETGLPWRLASPSWVGAPDTAPSSDPLSTAQAGISALALASVASTSSQLAVDFIHPKLAPPPMTRATRQTVLRRIVVAVILIATIAGACDLARLEWQVAAADRQLADLAPRLAAAQPYVEKMEFAASFHPGRLDYLACIRDLTVAVPQDGSVFLTSFNLAANMRGTFSGNASDRQAVLDLIDRLKSTGRFRDLNFSRLDRRTGPTKLSPMTFGVNFGYVAPQ